MSKHGALSKALEHYELGTTHLGISLHLLTEHTLVVGTQAQEERVVFLGMVCATFLSEVQPVLKALCDEGLYQMPHEALSALANADPRTYLKAASAVREQVMEPGAWVCDCGALSDPVSSAWRWNGRDWEHHHPYPMGHVVARKKEHAD